MKEIFVNNGNPNSKKARDKKIKIADHPRF
jgi:hypothetical protein